MGDNGLTFVICTGNEVVEAVLRPDGSYDFDPNEHENNRDCPWAVAHAATVLTDAPDVTALSNLARQIDETPARDSYVPTAPPRAPPARGPPLFA